MQVMNESDICIPGERLGNTVEFGAGNGTYVRSGFIYSKLCGVKSKTVMNGKEVIEVTCNKTHSVIPEVDSVAMCKVVTNNPRFCKAIILSVNGVTIKATFKGIVRQEDVRALEKDRVKMYESFRPGDIILARIMSLGDSQSYYLSTAENELGVIYAVSESGHPMIPISWCQMQCSTTGKIEHRKVAKVKIRQV